MLRPILRRGDLTNNILSAVIAIGSLLMLIFLGVKLYNFFVSQDEKNAAAFLDGLKAKIDALEEGEIGNFVLRGIEGWSLVGWSRDGSLSVKPQKCFDISCLCACPSTGDIVNSCQEKGICRKVEFNSVQFSTAKGVADSGFVKDLLEGAPDKIDAFLWFDFKLHALSGDSYYVFNWNGAHFVFNQKDSISSKWMGVPSDVDAVVKGYGAESNSYYFFKGDNYWKFHGLENKLISGPTSISQYWPGIPISVGAAFNTIGVPAAYFFKGNLYWKYDSDKSLADGYPKLIAGNWGGAPSDIDSVFEYDSDVYFIKGGKYYLYRYLGFDSPSAIAPTNVLLENSIIELKKTLAEFGIRNKDGNLFISDKALQTVQVPQA